VENVIKHMSIKTIFIAIPVRVTIWIIAAIVIVPVSASIKVAAILAPAETLSGRISMVDEAKKLLIVTDANGTPFDFVVTPSTRILSQKETLALQKLSSGDMVSIRFLPERKGDIAEKIVVG
jgi:hypothetical protein